MGIGGSSDSKWACGSLAGGGLWEERPSPRSDLSSLAVAGICGGALGASALSFLVNAWLLLLSHELTFMWKAKSANCTERSLKQVLKKKKK